MPRFPTRTAALLTLCVLPLACGPAPHSQAPQQPEGTEQPEVAAAPAPSEDPGLLLTIMIGLGQEMNEISGALWRNDLASVAAAARAIADHPHVSTAERERIQAALGEGFAEFVKGDQRVHQSAVRLAEQAAAEEMSATLEELAELQTGCVDCHDGFREALKTSGP